jgi:hypothetical protein
MTIQKEVERLNMEDLQEITRLLNISVKILLP